MTEQSNGPAEPPPTPPPGPMPSAPPSGYAQGAAPQGPPPGPYGATGPTQPMPQWYPAPPRQSFRERTTRLWLAIVASLACLVVGLGVGIAIGHATGHDDHGPGRFGRFPGQGPGP